MRPFLFLMDCGREVSEKMSGLVASFPIATKERSREFLSVVGDSRYLVPQFWNDEVGGTRDLMTMNGKLLSKFLRHSRKRRRSVVGNLY